mmetsp:Transcript_64961/g.209212  ORF Transcript_64961/g.209212 Transcript_64961/m.209212 type:complete len:235 (-) Transcript_64961:234-938(-)
MHMKDWKMVMVKMQFTTIVYRVPPKPLPSFCRVQMMPAHAHVQQSSSEGCLCTDPVPLAWRSAKVPSLAPAAPGAASTLPPPPSCRRAAGPGAVSALTRPEVVPAQLVTPIATQHDASVIAQETKSTMRNCMPKATQRSLLEIGCSLCEQNIARSGLLFRRKHHRSLPKWPYQRTLFAAKSWRRHTSAAVYSSSRFCVIIAQSCLSRALTVRVICEGRRARSSLFASILLDSSR